MTAATENVNACTIDPNSQRRRDDDEDNGVSFNNAALISTLIFTLIFIIFLTCVAIAVYKQSQRNNERSIQNAAMRDNAFNMAVFYDDSMPHGSTFPGPNGTTILCDRTNIFFPGRTPLGITEPPQYSPPAHHTNIYQPGGRVVSPDGHASNISQPPAYSSKTSVTEQDNLKRNGTGANRANVTTSEQVNCTAGDNALSQTTGQRQVHSDTGATTATGVLASDVPSPPAAAAGVVASASATGDSGAVMATGAVSASVQQRDVTNHTSETRQPPPPCYNDAISNSRSQD